MYYHDDYLSDDSIEYGSFYKSNYSSDSDDSIFNSFKPSTYREEEDDETYKSLRQKASELFKRAKFFSEQATEYYESGYKDKAFSSSQKSKTIRLQAEKANKEAADYVFNKKNTQTAENEIDLHGLYVTEAIDALERWITRQKRGQRLLAIVGRGKHSDHGFSKVKNAVMAYCQRCGYDYQPDFNNPGLVIIDF